jgi:hypothetical protein
MRSNYKLARFLLCKWKARIQAQTEDRQMQHNDKKTTGAMAHLVTFSASATLLITICFAPALAQPKDQINHDGTSSQWPVAVSYLA